MIVVVLVTTLFVFFLSRATGDPRLVLLDQYTTEAQWDAWGLELGLDKPLIVQFLIWLQKAATGDFGQSLAQRTNALDVISSRIPATLQLASGAMIFALVVGVPLGVLSAVRRGSTLDYVGRVFALFGQALPPFWLGIMLILIFSVQFNLLPTSQRGGIEHYILPSVTLGWLVASGFLRLIRSSMLEVLDSEFIKFARAKGVANQKIIWKHAFRNAALAPLTYAGLVLASLISGTVVTETVFAWPGIGRLAVQSVFLTDFPVLTGIVMILTVVYVVTNFLVDITYALLDPRIRFS